MKDYKIALERLFAGEHPKFSTGICESTTCGYGTLDSNGYWEHPLPEWIHRHLSAGREIVAFLENNKITLVKDVVLPNPLLGRLFLSLQLTEIPLPIFRSVGDSITPEFLYLPLPFGIYNLTLPK